MDRDEVLPAHGASRIIIVIRLNLFSVECSQLVPQRWVKLTLRVHNRFLNVDFTKIPVPNK